MTPNEEATLRIIRAVMLKTHFRADSCIAATKIVKEYLETRGFDGDGFKAMAVAYNRQFAEYLQEHRAEWNAPDLRDPTFLKVAVEARHQPGAWNVAIGAPTGPNALHVIYVGSRAGETWLVDLSIDQAARPQHGMALEPIIERMPRDIAEALMVEDAAITLNSADGDVVLTYQLIPGLEFHESGNWGERDAQLRSDIIQIARQVVRENAMDRAIRHV